MISCSLLGRCGNQAFQISTAFAHSLRMGTSFGIPHTTQNSRLWPMYFGHLPRAPKNHRFDIYQEKDHTYTPLPEVDNIKIVGYWQSEKYFIDYRDEVLKLFNFPYNPNFLVSVHIRRTDYLHFPDKHPVQTMDYYRAAMDHFPGRTFMIFSDDIKWCKQNFIGPQFIFSERKSAVDDLITMSNCEHNIICNSSFSWWAGWYNRNPDKIVIAPRKWFGPGNSALSEIDIVPEKWIRI